VAIAGFAFHPKSLTVKVGTTVTWKNDDQFAHQVKSSSGDPGVAFDLGAQNAGQSVSHQFTAPGTYRYYCNIHHYMTGTVVVTP
jgi:plastocyanin